jgi:hypothetical protein
MLAANNPGGESSWELHGVQKYVHVTEHEDAVLFFNGQGVDLPKSTQSYPSADSALASTVRQIADTEMLRRRPIAVFCLIGNGVNVVFAERVLEKFPTTDVHVIVPFSVQDVLKLRGDYALGQQMGDWKARVLAILNHAKTIVHTVSEELFELTKKHQAARLPPVVAGELPETKENPYISPDSTLMTKFGLVVGLGLAYLKQQDISASAGGSYLMHAAAFPSSLVIYDPKNHNFAGTDCPERFLAERWQHALTAILGHPHTAIDLLSARPMSALDAEAENETAVTMTVAVAAAAAAAAVERLEEEDGSKPYVSRPLPTRQQLALSKILDPNELKHRQLNTIALAPTVIDFKAEQAERKSNLLLELTQQKTVAEGMFKQDFMDPTNSQPQSATEPESKQGRFAQRMSTNVTRLARRRASIADMKQDDFMKLSSRKIRCLLFVSLRALDDETSVQDNSIPSVLLTADLQRAILLVLGEYQNLFCLTD